VTAIRAAGDALVAALLAPCCAACARPLERPLDGAVCSTCWALVHPAGEYEGSLREIIHAFKYQGRRSLAAPLAGLMRGRGASVLRDAACVVPVPLHPLRRLQRGFNQAADLAAHLQRPVVSALWRIRFTTPQAGLDGAQRRRNVRGAFFLSPLLSRRTRATLVEDRIVVLVDDVTTTGATLAACARVLERAGARDVRALTAARVPGLRRGPV
jgi:ComF family protein